ncbi:MAG: RHS repeat-associated core domain-containing protein, partial [Longimicrobiales bacterium]
MATREYFYDGLGRNTGFGYYDLDILQWIQMKEVCLYDPIGRLRTPCENGTVMLGHDGANTVRTGNDGASHAWTFVHGPGTDDPLMAYRSGDEKYLYFITDGAGRQYAVGDTAGVDYSSHQQYASSTTGGKYAGGITNANSFGAERYGNSVIGQLSFFRNRFYDQATGRWTQEDPLGVAAGTNLYAYVGNNPASYTDPFGLCMPWPQCALAAGRAGAAAGTLVGAGVGALGAGAGAVPGAAIGNRVGWVVGVGLATAGTVYMAGRHSRGVDRVNTSVSIANEHLGRVAGMPPDDDDPQFVRDMVNHAQKHLNNAKKYIKDVSGKTRDQLKRQ